MIFLKRPEGYFYSHSSLVQTFFFLHKQSVQNILSDLGFQVRGLTWFASGDLSLNSVQENQKYLEGARHDARH
jgi:hypothetical protein